MKPLLALVVVAASVSVGTAGAATPEYDYDRWFGTIARQSLRQSARDEAGSIQPKVKSVAVRCYRDKASFEQSLVARSGMSARRVIAYYAGGRDLHLRNGTCANIRLFFLGRHTVYSAGAYSILLHEALHRQGIAHEAMTTCFANESVRWGALWFGFSEAQALRARNLALTYTRLYSPRSYRMSKPNCLALTRKTEWTDIA